MREVSVDDLILPAGWQAVTEEFTGPDGQLCVVVAAPPRTTMGQLVELPAPLHPLPPDKAGEEFTWLPASYQGQAAAVTIRDGKVVTAVGGRDVKARTARADPEAATVGPFRVIAAIRRS